MGPCEISSSVKTTARRKVAESRTHFGLREGSASTSAEEIRNARVPISKK
jgi:hypothetical protein